MKRKLLGLICACLLLSGCGNELPKPVQTDPPATEIPTTEASATEKPSVNYELPLLEQGTALDESENVRHIPNETVQSMASPKLRLLGNGLLLSEYRDDQLVLKHISLEKGQLVAEGAISAGADAKLFIGSGEMGVCDRESGLVTILDEAFQPLRVYDVPREGDDWYLNSELDTLFIFFSDRGMVARNLETCEDNWLVDNGFRVETKGSGSGYVIFEYTDRANQKTCTRYLNLSMAALETLPVGGAVADCFRQGQNWLIREREGEQTYLLVQEEQVSSFKWEGSSVRLLSPKRHLLAMDASCRNLTVYEADGTFLSRCSLPMSSDAAVGADFVWSGYWEGYFFTDFTDSSCRLMFWDVNAESTGEDLPLTPLGEAESTQTLLEPQLYERAAQLSQRFGVDIRIAEQCTLDYSHYDTYPMTDPVFVRSALDILEDCLSRYPEGFFRQLIYGSIESIRIELVGGLMGKSDVTTHPDSVGGFAQDRGSYYTIVLDGFLLQPKNVYHEFSHIIDARLEWDALIREDALYSEESWLALQPRGFSYAMSYTAIPEDVRDYADSGYFIAEYALTYPTEDRATLMAAAMENYTWDFEPGSGKRAKMQFYADCIRDCFDTAGWPEVTAWEQVLQIPENFPAGVG